MVTFVWLSFALKVDHIEPILLILVYFFFFLILLWFCFFLCLCACRRWPRSTIPSWSITPRRNDRSIFLSLFCLFLFNDRPRRIRCRCYELIHRQAYALVFNVLHTLKDILYHSPKVDTGSPVSVVTQTITTVLHIAYSIFVYCYQGVIQ